MVHRDIKPENILFSGGRALVADFGIARALGKHSGALSRERPAEAGLAMGTPAYMSPEQVSGSRRVDRRTDIYSLGCVLYEMLGGEPPYTGPTPQAAIAKLLLEPVPHVRALREGLPAAVEQAVTRALAKARSARFRTAEEFGAALAPKAVATGSLSPDAIAPGSGVLRGRTRWALGGGGLTVVVVAAAALALWHPLATVPAGSRVAPTDARRVVVAAFANQTGDSSLAPLGDIVADYLARGLAETRVLEVVDARAAQPSDSATHLQGPDGARALARGLGAGAVIWGTYSRRGDSLVFNAQVAETATGRTLAPILPAAGPAARPTEGVEVLRQHVMSALAERFDRRLALFADTAMSHAVSYEAYREYLMADVMPFGAAAIAHYRRSYALDSTFTLPIIDIAGMSAFGEEGQCRRTDSIADVLHPRHDRLPPLDRLFLDALVADCRGDREKAFYTLREMMAVAPRSDWVVLRYALHARLTGRLREVIDALEKVEPPGHGQTATAWGHWVYWESLILSYHMLGDHRRELAVAQRARRTEPGLVEILVLEAGALAALGRLTELNAVVDEMARIPAEASQGGNFFGGPAGDLDAVGRELQAHGYRPEAQILFDRASRWIKARPAAEQRELRADLATVLYDGRHWEEARGIVNRLAAESPNDRNVQAMLGAIAARLGERKEVARVDRWLADLKDPYLRGVHTLDRSRLAAILGDRDRAVELYRQAQDEGLGYLMCCQPHADPDFDSVRDYPPFQELTRPKD
jgi:TolB-like protein/tetratricopeptide (TPR) repeat protein